VNGVDDCLFVGCTSTNIRMLPRTLLRIVHTPDQAGLGVGVEGV
jgi:hypothetical protein